MTSPEPSPGPEAALLLLCARVDLSPAGSARLARLVKQDLDWPTVLVMAKRHGIARLLYRHLQACEPGSVPAGVLHDLHQTTRSITLRNLAQTREMLRIVDRLDAAGVEVMPFKGPMLGAMAYGDATLREFGDLDFLVHRADIPRFKDVLDTMRYRPHARLDAQEEQAYIDTQMGYDFIREDGAVAVEMHWSFLNKIHAFDLDPEEVWKRSRTITMAGQRVRQFADEDLLLYLCAHGSRSFWKRLIWVCDVAELIRARPGLDWPGLRERAHRLGSDRMLDLGLYLAHTLLDAPVPADFIARAQHDEAVIQLAHNVQNRLFRSLDASLSTFWKMRFHLSMRDRLKDRLPYFIHLFRLCFAPNTKDRSVLELPNELSFLYTLIRPLRLLYSAGSGLATLFRQSGSRAHN